MLGKSIVEGGSIQAEAPGVQILGQSVQSTNKHQDSLLSQSPKPAPMKTSQEHYQSQISDMHNSEEDLQNELNQLAAAGYYFTQVQ